MPELIERIDFQRIHFANRIFTPKEVQSAINDLAKYLRANRVSEFSTAAPRG